MDYRKIDIEKIKNVLNLIKQNGYEIDCELLNNMCRLDYLYTYLSMIVPIYCDNGNVYCRLFIDGDGVKIIKFKDYPSINTSFKAISTKKDYNFDYNEENFVVNNHAFTITYIYTTKYSTFGTYNIYILDKDSRKLLIEIDCESSDINIDIFKLFNKSIYKRYKNGHQWINNYAGLLPSELTSIITKCQVLLSLSS